MGLAGFIKKRKKKRIKEEAYAYVIGESGITARHGQQLTYNVHVTMFTGTHKSSGAVVIADVDLRPTGQQRPYHVASTVADG